ncbi:MAG: ABC transporter substrate-binding protein [Hyphomicrobiaceae bacterium]
MSRLKKISYGVPSGNDALTVRFGIEEGLFEDEGLDLSMQVVFGGPDIAAAFDTGEVPIGSLGSPSGIISMASGKRFRIIASGCRQRAHMYLGVRKDIRNYQQLKQKRIGLLSIGSCPSWIIHRMLAQHGLDADQDVTLVPLFDNYPRIIEIMEEGGIDACLATEPNLSIGEDRNVLDIWAAGYEEAYLPRFQWIVRVANIDFIEQEPALVNAVLSGCRRSAHHAANHIEKFSNFVAGYYGASVPSARRAMQREVPRYQLDCEIDLQGLQNSIDMLFELGGIDRPLKPSDVTDLRFQFDARDAQSA